MRPYLKNRWENLEFLWTGFKRKVKQLERRLANVLGQNFLSWVGTRPRSIQLPGFCSPATGYFGAGDELKLKTSSAEANYNGSQKNWSWWWWESSTNSPRLTHTTERFKKMKVLTSSWVKQKVQRESSETLFQNSLEKFSCRKWQTVSGVTDRQLCLVRPWVKLWKLCRFLSRIHLKLDGKWAIRVYLVKIQQNNAVKSSEARMLILNSQEFQLETQMTQHSGNRDRRVSEFEASLVDIASSRTSRAT